MRLLSYEKIDSEWSFLINDYSSLNLLGILDGGVNIFIRSFYAEDNGEIYTTSDIAKIDKVEKLKDFLISKGEFFVHNKLMFDVEDKYTVRFNDDSECQVLSEMNLTENEIVTKILMGLGYEMKIFNTLSNNIGHYLLLNLDGTIHKRFKDFTEYIDSTYS